MALGIDAAELEAFVELVLREARAALEARDRVPHVSKARDLARQREGRRRRDARGRAKAGDQRSRAPSELAHEKENAPADAHVGHEIAQAHAVPWATARRST